MVILNDSEVERANQYHIECNTLKSYLTNKYKNKCFLTLNEIVIETNLSLKEVKNCITSGTLSHKIDDISKFITN